MLLKKRKTTNKGFLLIELLVSFAIITFVILSLTIAVLGMIFTKKQFIMQESAKDISKQIVGTIMKRESNIDFLISKACSGAPQTALPNNEFTNTMCTNNKYSVSNPRRWGVLIKFKKNLSYTAQDPDFRTIIDPIEFFEIQKRIKEELSPNASIQIYIANVTGILPGVRSLPSDLEKPRPLLLGSVNPLIGIPVEQPSQITPPGYINGSSSNTMIDGSDTKNRRIYITSVINYNLKSKSAIPLDENKDENTSPTDKNQIRQITSGGLMSPQMTEVDQTLCNPNNDIVGNNCSICKNKPKYVRCESCILNDPLPASFPIPTIASLTNNSYKVLNDYCPQCYNYRSSGPIPPGGIPMYCKSCSPRLDPNNLTQLDPNQIFSSNCKQCQGTTVNPRCQSCFDGTTPKPAGCVP